MIHALPRGSGFVGRREELAVLHDEFERVRDEQAQFVTIEGDAGIGKSRLVGEFVRAIDTPATVLLGQCSEQVRSPYLPMSAILAHLDLGETKEKAAFFCAVAEAFERAAYAKPIVAVVEDLQWADSATLELLAYLVQHLGPAHVLFVGTLRADESVRNASLASFRYHAMRSRATVLPLRGLRRNDVRQLVTLTLGRQGKFIAPETISHIESLSEGNPLFAEELAHVAVDAGTLNLATHMPLSIQAMLAERLISFNDDERTTLIYAAIVGQRFDAAFLAKILDVPLVAVLAVLQHAVDAGIVLASRSSPVEFTFRHAMIRQALSDQLILGLAAPLHVRIAEELQTLPDARERAVELAYHWSAARIAEKARYYNERAAEEAWDVYAYRDAIDFYSAALRWEYPPGPERAAVYERLGTLLYIEGCGEEPALWFRRCYDEHERLGNPAGMAHALLLLTDQHWVDARTTESLDAAAQAASTIARIDDPKTSAETLLSLARFSITLGDAARARDHLDAARTYDDAFDTALRASFHEVRAEIGAALGQSTQALEDCATACRLAAAVGSSELIAQIENNVALVACDLGEIELAVERHEIAMAEARRTSMLWRVAYSALNYAHTLMLKGELQRARGLVWEALEAGVTTATVKTKAATVGIPLALMLNDRRLLDACGDDDALNQAIRSREIQRLGSVAAAFAALRSAQGAQREAAALLARTIGAIPRIHRCWNLVFRIALDGSPASCATVRDILRSSTARPRMIRNYRLLFEALALRHANPERATRLAQAAATTFSRLGYPLYETLALEAAGATDEAIRRHEAMGNIRDAQRLRAASQPHPALIPALSARQIEVARLVADGETNRSIAARLHISEHTVEHHLSTIFVRLGIRSRSQLAARIAARQ